MGLLYCPKTGKAQSRIKFCKYRLWHRFFKACIFIAGLILFFFNTAFGQVSLLEKTISIPKQTTTLYEALNLISHTADCLFIYDSETLESDKRVKLYADHQPLNEVLDHILSNPGLAYRVLGKHILIYKVKKEAPPVNKMQQAVPSMDVIKNVVIRGHIYDKEN